MPSGSRSVACDRAARHNVTHMRKNQTGSLTTVPQIERRILVIRGQKMMVDADVAEVVTNCDHLAKIKFSKALRQLMAPPAQTDKRPIGFVTPQEKKGKR